MSETNVTIAIFHFLKSKKINIIQCIPPGNPGQHYLLDEKKRVFPDFICFDKQSYFVGESKESKNQSDINKLKRIKNNKENLNLLINIHKNFSKANNLNFEKIDKIIFFHAYENLHADDLILDGHIEHWIVNDGQVKILK